MRRPGRPRHASSPSRRTSSIVDVGLKTEGRIPLREFGVDDGARRPRRSATSSRSILERVENALGDAVISREKARREEAWTRLEVVFAEGRAGQRRHRRPRQGRLHRRPRRRLGLPAGLAGRHPPGARRRPADGQGTAVRHPEDGPSARQHRRLAPRHPGRSPRRTAHRTGRPAAGRRSPRRRGQEHHRLRRVRGPGRHRRPAARHRHELEARHRTRARCSPSATRSRSRSSRSTRTPSASRSA